MIEVREKIESRLKFLAEHISTFLPAPVDESSMADICTFIPLAKIQDWWIAYDFPGVNEFCLLKEEEFLNEINPFLQKIRDHFKEMKSSEILYFTPAGDEPFCFYIYRKGLMSFRVSFGVFMFGTNQQRIKFTCNYIAAPISSREP